MHQTVLAGCHVRSGRVILSGESTDADTTIRSGGALVLAGTRPLAAVSALSHAQAGSSPAVRFLDWN
jgi:hypothetical protein